MESPVERRTIIALFTLWGRHKSNTLISICLLFFLVFSYGTYFYRFPGLKKIEVCVQTNPGYDARVPLLVSGRIGHAFSVVWSEVGGDKFVETEIWGSKIKTFPISGNRISLRFSDNNSELLILDDNGIVFKDENLEYAKIRTYRNEGIGFSPIDWSAGDGVTKLLNTDCESPYFLENKLSIKTLNKLTVSMWLEIATALLLIIVGIFLLPILWFQLHNIFWNNQK